MICDAILTRGIPVDLATNGIVLLPLGFTSNIKILSFWIANCMLIKPTTFNPFANFFVCKIISLIICLRRV